MTRRVWVVESRRPGGEWLDRRTSRCREQAELSCEYLRDLYVSEGYEWRVVEYVPRDGSGG